MNVDNIILPADEPSIKPLYVECKFTVESRQGRGGDWERNTGGDMIEKRVAFEGFATNELYNAVMAAVADVLHVGGCEVVD